MLYKVLTLDNSQLLLWLLSTLSMTILVFIAFYLGYKKGRECERKMLKWYKFETESRKAYEKWLEDKQE